MSKFQIFIEKMMNNRFGQNIIKEIKFLNYKIKDQLY